MARILATPRSRWWWVPCPAFLIRHPSYGPFVVDTGLHSSVSAKPAANLGRAVSLDLAARASSRGEDLPTQLRERGVDSATLKLVVMTHLHIDHASGMAEFPRATFVVSEAEWDAATTDPRPLLRGYRPEHYDYVFDYRTVGYRRRRRPPTRPSAAPSTCSATAAFASLRRRGTRPATSA